MARCTLLLSLFALAAVLLTGCGGGTKLTAPKTTPAVMGPTTSATMTIVWPARSRLIPVAANSIRVTIENAQGVTDSRTVGRPAQGGTSQIFFDSLPIGSLTVTATAHPDYYGYDTPQAAATVSATAKMDEPLVLTVVMQSTITGVMISPTGSYVAVGNTRMLTATALNADNYAVMVQPTGAFTWTSSNTNIATVDQDGVVTGVAEGGPVTITATERESGVSGTTQVTVGTPLPPVSYVTVTSVQDESNPGKVNLLVQWPPVSTADVTGYNIYRTASMRQTGFTLIASVPNTQITYRDTSVMSSYGYTYFVTTTGNGRESQPTYSGSFTVTFPPGNVVALQSGTYGGYAYLTWVTPVILADGETPMWTGERYEIYRSTTLPLSSGMTIEQATLFTQFVKIANLSWGTTTYLDVSLPQDVVGSYVVVPVDVTGQRALAPYTVVQVQLGGAPPPPW